MKKKRPNIIKLRNAARIAREQLVKHGVLSEKSLIDEIEKDPANPKLPGQASYLPRPETLKASQRMMYDMIFLWKEECKGDKEMEQHIGKFFDFLILEIQVVEKKSKKEEKAMKTKIERRIRKIPTLHEVFAPTQKKETASAMCKFFADSFAIAIVVKNYEDVNTYVTWFLDWTEQLINLWPKMKIPTNDTQPALPESKK